MPYIQYLSSFNVGPYLRKFNLYYIQKIYLNPYILCNFHQWLASPLPQRIHRNVVSLALWAKSTDKSYSLSFSDIR